jgi:hypothetical protein
MTFPTRVLHCPGSKSHVISYLHYYNSGPLAARSMRPGLVVVGINAFQRGTRCVGAATETLYRILLVHVLLSGSEYV